MSSLIILNPFTPLDPNLLLASMMSGIAAYTAYKTVFPVIVSALNFSDKVALENEISHINNLVRWCTKLRSCLGQEHLKIDTDI